MGQDQSSSASASKGAEEELKTLPAPQRHLVALDPPLEAKGAEGEGQLLKFMTYNILAQMYWGNEYDSYCPSFAKHRSYRLNLVLKEVQQYEPDVVCMQEVDCIETLKPQMTSLGYSCVFKKRTGWHPDGSALFYNRKKLKVVKTKELELDGIAEWEHSQVQKTPSHFIRNNIAIICLLEYLDAPDSSCPFVVCTGHTYWDPRCDDVKLMQMHALSTLLARFIEKKEKKLGGKKLPYLLAGDFNHTPDSSIYHYVRHGRLEDDDPYRERYSFSLEHSLSLKSAYETLNHPTTNFTLGFRACIDYIFYGGAVHVTKVLGPLDEEDKALQKCKKCLPNAWFPSDHICLVGHFVFPTPSKGLVASEEGEPEPTAAPTDEKAEEKEKEKDKDT